MRKFGGRIKLAVGAVAAATCLSMVAACGSSGGSGDTKGGGSGSAALTKVVIATPANSAASAFLYVALGAGYFKANGLDVSLNSSIAPPSTPAALTKGSVQATALTGTATTARQAGLPLVNIVETATHAPFVILANKGINSVTDLVGKTLITSPAFGSLGAASNDILTRAGVNGKVKLVTLDAVPAKSALYVAGKGDAIFEALNNAMDDRDKVPGSTIITSADASSSVPANGLAVTESYLKDHANTVKALIKSCLQAANMIKNDQAGAAKLIATAFKLSDADAKQFVEFQAPSIDLSGAPSQEAFQNQADQYNSQPAQAGKQKVNWTAQMVASSWDTTLAKQVAKELGYS